MMLLTCLIIGAIDVPDRSIVMLIGIGLFQQGVKFRARCHADRLNGFNAEWFNSCDHIKAPQNEAPNRSFEKIMGLMRRGCLNWTALSARKSLLIFKAGAWLSSPTGLGVSLCVSICFYLGVHTVYHLRLLTDVKGS